MAPFWLLVSPLPLSRTAGTVLGEVSLWTTLGTPFGVSDPTSGEEGGSRLQGGRTERRRSYRRGEGLTEVPWRMREWDTDMQKEKEE